MEFFIKKKSTLPKLSVEVIMDSRVGFRQSGVILTGATTYFSMYDVDTKIYTIKDDVAEISYNDTTNRYVLTYGVGLRHTKKIGTYVGYFTINNDGVSSDLPINDGDVGITIHVIDSISVPDICCKQNR